MRWRTSGVALGALVATGALQPILANENHQISQLLDRESHDSPAQIEHSPSDQLLIRKTVDPSRNPVTAGDTTGVWFHLRRKNLAAAEAELARQKNDHPQWQPPQQLVDALNLARLREALASGKIGEARRLSDLDFNRCTHPDIAWGLADAGIASERARLLKMAVKCGNSGVQVGSMNHYLRPLTESQRLAEIDHLLHQKWPAAVRRAIEGFGLGKSLAELNDAALPASRIDSIGQEVAVLHNAGGADALGWQRLNAHDPEGAKHWFAQALAWSRGQTGLEGLARSMIALGDEDGAITLVKDAPDLKKVLADALVARALSRIKQSAPLDEITPDIQEAASLGRSDAWETVGWGFIDGDHAGDAVRAFKAAPPTESAYFGLVMAERAAGHGESATNIACERRALSARLRQSCADGLAEQQLQAYQAGSFAAAHALGERLAQIAPENRGGRTLDAWSSLRLHQPAHAVTLFGELYDQSPDRDVAEGLLESYEAAGDRTTIARRLAMGDPIFAAVVAQQKSDVAFDRKQFDLSQSVSPQTAQPALAGRDGWIVGSGIEVLSANGDSGLGHLDILAPKIFTTGMIGNVRVGAALVGAYANVGLPTPTADIGTRMGSLTESYPAWGAGNIWEPMVSLHWEMPDWTLAAQISSTPINAPVAAEPTINVSIERHGDPLAVTARLFDDNVVSSMLSLGGLRDPVSGKSWGRVLQQGGSLQAVYLPADRVSVSLTGVGAYFTGHDVASNERFGLRNDLAYDFRPAWSDHLRFGPFFSADHFDTNLSHFSFGQGGYYSPDLDARTGFLVDLLTKEGGTWQVEAKTSLSYGYAYQAESPRYNVNLTPIGDYSSVATAGLNKDASVRGSLLLNDRLILSGFGRFAMAPAYTDYTFGLFLAYAFAPRRGVYSADLPDGVFTPFR